MALGAPPQTSMYGLYLVYRSVPVFRRALPRLLLSATAAPPHCKCLLPGRRLYVGEMFQMMYLLRDLAADRQHQN